MWTIFKVLIELVTVLLLFCFGFLLDCEACGTLTPTRMEPALALEGEVTPPLGNYFVGKQICS